MASKDHIFGISGPFNLTSIDWTNPYHRRSIAASLVKGAYILEHDRQQYREDTPQALAPPWWESFGFRLHKKLEDKRDGSYFGAIYEYIHWRSNYNYPGHPPRYVISFRGTIKKLANLRDFKIDFLLTFNQLHLSSRLRHGMDIARNMVKDNGDDNVWLAGHSKGSAIALMVGMKIFKMGFNLETYLFNPPFPSTPIEHIGNEKVKKILRKVKSRVTSLIAKVLPNPSFREHFSSLSDWIPHLFVNQSDPICCGYIRYFDQVISNDTSDIEKLAAKNSILAKIIPGQESEIVHLLPSANLTIHLTCNEDFKQAHSIDQWWRTDLYCKSRLHQFMK